MAYNYGNYQPYYQVNGGYSGQQFNAYVPNSYSGQGMQTAVPANSIPFYWINGPEEAASYPVGAGNTVHLIDMNNPYIYKKSTDITGRPLPIEAYKLVKEDAMPNQVKPVEPDLSEYVKISDLETKVNELVNKALGQ